MTNHTYTPVRTTTPMGLWGKDHWSLLGYVESVLVECKRFELGQDARMRMNEATLNNMRIHNPNPKRPTGKQSLAIAMRPEHGTRLKDNQVLINHDDLECLKDFADTKLIDLKAEDLRPGAFLSLSDKGQKLSYAVRKHKAGGGNFANFDVPAEFQVSDAADLATFHDHPGDRRVSSANLTANHAPTKTSKP